MGESKRSISGIKDSLNIILLRLAKFKRSNHKAMPRIKGVPVNVIGNLKRNRAIVGRVRQQFKEVSKDFEEVITLTAEALRVSGKYHDTDRYLERGILEGGRERDAYRHFLVERREVDRALLMMIFDREKINQLTLSNTSPDEEKRPSCDHWAVPEVCGRGRMGSVIDDNYSSEIVQQVEYYFDLIFKEETIIHVLGNTQKIVSILRLPYELPQIVYQREPYPSESPNSLTGLLSVHLIGNQSSL